MKKAIAYLNKNALIALLKIPYQVELVGMEYPSKNDKIKITIQGDDLPVKKTDPKAKRLPEVDYTVLHHWHMAKIAPKEAKDE